MTSLRSSYLRARRNAAADPRRPVPAEQQGQRLFSAHPRNPQAARPNVIVSGSLSWLAAALLLCASGCEKAAPKSPPPPVVQVLEMAATNVPRSVTFIGQLDSPQNVEVRARVEAFVDQIQFAEGTDVNEGDPLFLLDKKPFDERLAAANGMLAEAMAALNKYEKDVARLQPLAEKKAIPQQDLDNAVASVAVGQANVESARARVKSAELDLGYCEVKAPVSGRIGAKAVSVGSLVGKGEPTLLATISQLHPIWFYCAISTVDYLHAERTAKEAGRQMGELPVTLVLEDGTEHPEPGKWVFLDRAVDVTTGTIRARAEFPNPEKLLRPGMFARIRISLHTERGHLLVPERALVELQGQYFVWVVGAGDTAHQREVIVAPARIGSSALILEGLKAGERIVVEGLQKVREGAPVQPRTAAQIAEALAAHPDEAAGTRPARAGQE